MSTIIRRHRNRDGSVIEPMTLANMRENGVSRLDATCEACRHRAELEASLFSDEMAVPDVGLRLRCSACGSKEVSTRPAWRYQKVS
jgi:hypothetical protein